MTCVLGLSFFRRWLERSRAAMRRIITLTIRFCADCQICREAWCRCSMVRVVFWLGLDVHVGRKLYRLMRRLGFVVWLHLRAMFRGVSAARSDLQTSVGSEMLRQLGVDGCDPVSYTHLTLPTIYSV